MQARLVSNSIIVLALTVTGLLIAAGLQRPPDLFLEGIRERGVLRVGVDPTYPPFASIENGQILGYDADLARSLAADLGVEVEFKALALDTLYDALEAGSVDVLVSALPFIYERQVEVRYSVPYFQAGQVLVVRQGESSINGVAGLSGKRLGLELGSGADTEARRLSRTVIPNVDLQPVYHSAEEALDALLAGQVDAVMADNVSVRAYLEGHTSGLRVLSPPVTDEPYVVAMPAGANTLAERVNAVIARLAPQQ